MDEMILSTDRSRSSMSEMLLYAENAAFNVHAALFSNFDGTMSLVVCGRNGEESGRSLRMSLSMDRRPFARTFCVTLQPGKTGPPVAKVTFDDLGESYVAIHFESMRRSLVV